MQRGFAALFALNKVLNGTIKCIEEGCLASTSNVPLISNVALIIVWSNIRM